MDNPYLDQKSLEIFNAHFGAQTTNIEPEAPPLQDQNWGERSLKQLGNLPSNSANLIANDFVGFSSMMSGRKLLESEKNYSIAPQIFDVAPAESRGAKIVDAVTTQLLPEIVEFSATMGVAGAALKGAKIGKLGSHVAKLAAASGVTRADEGDAGTLLHGAAQGGAGALLEGLPYGQRVLAATAMGGVDYATQRSMGRSHEEALMSSGVNAGASLIGKRIKDDALNLNTISDPENLAKDIIPNSLKQLNNPLPTLNNKADTSPIIENVSPLRPTRDKNFDFNGSILSPVIRGLAGATVGGLVGYADNGDLGDAAAVAISGAAIGLAPEIARTIKAIGKDLPKEMQSAEGSILNPLGGKVKTSVPHFDMERAVANPRGMTGESIDQGLAVKSLDDLIQLKNKWQVANEKATMLSKAFENGSMPYSDEAFMSLRHAGAESQFYRETYEAATGTGSMSEVVKNSNVPFPQGRTPDAIPASADKDFFYDLNYNRESNMLGGKHKLPNTGIVTSEMLQKFGGSGKPIKASEIALYKDIAPQAFDEQGNVHVPTLRDALKETNAVETHVYGMNAKASPERVALDELTHTWYDILTSEEQRFVQGYGRGSYSLDEVPQHLRDNTIKINNLRLPVIHSGKDTSLKATQHYKEISPFDTTQFPPERIDVALPSGGYDKKYIADAIEALTTEGSAAKAQNSYIGHPLSFWKEQISKPQLWKQDDLHENLPNTLGWAMVQEVKHPKTGERALFIGEQQSRWAQAIQKVEQKIKQSIEIIDGKVFATYGGKTNEMDSMEDAVKTIRSFYGNGSDVSHPLLKHQHELVLKAVTKEAEKRGIKSIIVSDGESAMMTEGHDKHATANEGRFRVAWDHPVIGAVTDLFNTEASALAKVKDLTTNGFKNAAYSEIKRVVSQEKGMLLHYDTTLPSAMKDIAGSKGERIELGTHKNVIKNPTPLDSFSRQIDIIDNDFNAGRITAEERTTRFANISQEQIGSPVFKNADGTPRSHVGGMEFKLGQMPSLKVLNYRNSIGGYAIDEALTQTTVALISAAIGGTYGYSESHGDIGSTIGGAVAGLIVGVTGVKMLERAIKEAGGFKDIPTTAKVAAKNVAQGANAIKPSSVKSKSFRDILDQMGADAAKGQGGFLANFVRKIEHGFDFNAPEGWNETILKGQGKIYDMFRTVVGIHREADKLNPTDLFKQTTELYRRGVLLKAKVVEKLLDSEHSGVITMKDYLKENQITRDILSRNKVLWQVRDDEFNSNTTGEGIREYWITPLIREKILEMQTQAYELAAGKHMDNLKYMETGIRGRVILNEALQLAKEGLPEKERLLIERTQFQYQPRTFKIFNEYPTQDLIDKQVDEQVKFNIIHKARQAGTLKKIPESNYSKITNDFGKDYYIPTLDLKAGLDDHGQIFIERQKLNDYLNRFREEGKKFQSGGKASDIETNAFISRQVLTPTMRKVLGEVTDPEEQLIRSFAHINGLMTGANIVSVTRNFVRDNGIKMYYTDEEFKTVVTSVLKSGDPEKIRTLQGMRQTNSDLSNGLVQNGWIDRFAFDRLKDAESPFGILENPVVRFLTKYTNEIKAGQTVLNPFTHIRNAIQTPIFMAMAGNFKPEHWDAAYQIMRNPKGAAYKELVELNVINGGKFMGELQYTLDDLVNGKTDSAIGKFWKKSKEVGGNIYEKPDQFVRISTFLTKRAELTEKYKGSKKSFNDITDEALKYTERRTPNYDGVPYFVKAARKVPGVNLYVSYAYEIARVMKNTIEDGIKGDYKALAVIGGMAAIPEAIQHYGESQLNEQDERAWKVAKGLSPTYSKNRYKIPIERRKDGSFSTWDYSSIVPHDQYAQIMRAVLKGDIGDAISSNPFFSADNSPILNVVTEFISKRDIRTGEELKTPFQRARKALQSLLPPVTPGIGYEYERSTPHWMGGRLGEYNTKTGREIPLLSLPVRIATGTNLSSVNPTTMLRGLKFDHDTEQRKIAGQIKSLSQLSGIPDEIKQHKIAGLMLEWKKVDDQFKEKLKALDVIK